MMADGRKVGLGQDAALPSVEMTRKFLALCDRCGSDAGAVAAVARGRRAGGSGLPDRDDWPEWNPAEMRAAVDYLQGFAAAAESPAPRRLRR